MSLMKRFGGRLPDFEEVVRRFPVTVAIMAVFTVWIIVDNYFGITSYRKDEYIYSGFILAGYISVIVKLIIEARKGSTALGAIVALALAVPAFLFSYFSKTLDFTAAMAIGAAVIFLGNAAAWRGGRQDRNVWNFTQKLWTGALFAVVGSVIFLLGMLAISEAVKALFGVNLDDLTMETILPIGLAFLAPVYWLGTLPRYGEAEDVTELSFEARALSFLGTWMLAPLVIIYALIVLAYGAKVLIQWDLPKGEIAQLVSPFIGVGMLVWLMLEPKVLKESGFVRFYRAAWHWIMLPAAVLLGVAVFVRIAEYGYTPIRFFLALVVTWAAVQSLWFIFMPKAKRDIRVPTALAAGLLVIGAFAAVPVSTMSQFQRGKVAKQALSVFDAETMLANPEIAKQFRGSLEYLIKQQDEKRFRMLLPEHDLPANTYGDKWTNIRRDLGLWSENDDTNFGNSGAYSLASEEPYRLSGDYDVYLSNYVDLWDKNVGVLVSNDDYKVRLDIGGSIYDVDLEPVFEGLSWVGANDSDIDTIVPPIPVTSLQGEPAIMLISGGSVEKRNEGVDWGQLNLTLIVPN